MAIKARHFLAGLSLTVGLFTAGQASAGQYEPTLLVLHLDNYAAVPPEHLERTKLEVTRVYKAAGIQTIWVDRERPSDPQESEPDTRPATHLRVLLLSQDMAASKIALEEIPANVLGRAARQTARAYILTQRVADLAARNRCDFSRLLSRVIAHEVGHLLLPPFSHSATGIMRESLDMWSRGNEQFTGAQRKKMLSALQARN